MSGDRNPVVKAFVHLANRYSAAVRNKDRVEVQGGDLDDAISRKQAVENEAAECFVLLRDPENMGQRR